MRSVTQLEILPEQFVPRDRRGVVERIVAAGRWEELKSKLEAAAEETRVLRQELATQKWAFDVRHAALVAENARLRALLADPDAAPDSGAPKPVRTICAEVCASHGVDWRDVIGRSVAAQICVIRGEIAFRLRSERGLSSPDIGRILQRDHSTVLNMLKRHAATMDMGGTGR